MNVVAAATAAQPRRLFTSQQMQSVDMTRGNRAPLGPPTDDIDQYWTSAERPAVEHKLTYSFVGAAATVRDGLSELIDRTNADELIVNMRIFDPAACLRTLEILADVRTQLAANEKENTDDQ